METAANNHLLSLLFFTLFACSTTHGQNRAVNLTQSISLPTQSIRLDSLLKIVSKNTGLVFSYDASKIKTSTLLTSKKRTINLIEVFTIIKEQAQLNSKLIDDHVILSNATPQAISKSTVPKAINNNKPTTSSINQIGQVKTNLENQLPKNIIHNDTQNATDSVAIALPATGTIQSDSANYLNTLIAIKPLDTVHSSMSPKQATGRIKKNSKGKKFSMPNLESKIGLSIDESTYVGANIQLGIPFLYGTASWHTNFSTNHFRFGAIASLKVTKRLNLQLSGNTGSIKQNYVLDSTSISPSYKLSVNSKLTRFGISAEFPVSKSILIQVGPNFNILQNDYYINSSPTSLSLLPNATDDYYTIKAPYTITTDFKPPNTYIQKWIGIQITVLYKINLYSK